MFGWLRRRAARSAPIADALWAQALADLRLLDARDEADRARLRERVEAFLGRREITGAGGLAVDERMRVLVAAQACLPLLHLPLDWLGHWHQVILYPGAFRVRRHHHDEESAVVTEWDDELAGESWSHGPLILSWADVEQDLAEPFEGFNVVIREIAHKIDMADGASDGMPPLPDAARRRIWRDTMQASFDALAAAVERGEDTVLDAYAAEAPDEFFAVVSEYYFTAPDVLAGHHRAVFDEFARFYGPVPMPAAGTPRLRRAAAPRRAPGARPPRPPRR